MSQAKPTLVNLETNETIESFGIPVRMVEGQSAKWSHRGGAVATHRTDYVASGAARYAVEMLFETAGPTQPSKKPTDVRQKLTPLQELVKKGSKDYPPPCLFTWGTIHAPVVVDDLEIHYLRFDQGIPTSAQVVLHLTELRDKEKLRQVACSPPGMSQGGVGGLAGLARGPAVIAVATVPRDAAAALAGQIRAAPKEFERQVNRSVEDAKAGVEKAAKTQIEAVKREAEAVVKKVETALNDIKGKIGQRAKEIEKELEELKQKGMEASQGLKNEIGQVEENFAAAKDKLATLLHTEVVNKIKSHDLSACFEPLQKAIGGRITKATDKLKEIKATSASKAVEQIALGHLERALFEIQKVTLEAKEVAERVNEFASELSKDISAAATFHEATAGFEKAVDPFIEEALRHLKRWRSSGNESVLAIASLTAGKEIASKLVDEARDKLNIGITGLEEAAMKCVEKSRKGLVDAAKTYEAELKNAELIVKQANDELADDVKQESQKLDAELERLRAQVDQGVQHVEREGKSLLHSWETRLKKLQGDVTKSATAWKDKLDGQTSALETKWLEFSRFLGSTN